MKKSIIAILVIAVSISASGHLAAKSEEFFSPPTGGNSATLTVAQKDQAETEKKYMGTSTAPVCQRKSGVECQENGACCTGGKKCKIILKLLKTLNEKTSKPAPLDFCS